MSDWPVRDLHQAMEEVLQYVSDRGSHIKPEASRVFVNLTGLSKDQIAALWLNLNFHTDPKLKLSYETFIYPFSVFSILPDTDSSSSKSAKTSASETGQLELNFPT